MKAVVYSSLFLVFVCCVTAVQKRYDGFQLWKVTPQDKSQVEALKVLYREQHVIFGDEPYYPNRQVDILVPPEIVADIRNYFRRESLQHVVKNPNYQNYLDDERARLDARYAKADGQRAFNGSDYNTWEDIMGELEAMAAHCSTVGLVCSTFSIGNSHEGRPLTVLKIGTGATGKKGYWIDTLIHAREWLSAATLLKVTDRLVREYGTHQQATELVNKYDWYYLPVHNPDGYVYSWTTDRLWRKNRHANEGSVCVGTDLNRNYDQEWATEGASGSVCSETYYGPSAASEPETQAVQNFAQSIQDSIVCWLTIHTAAQMWLVPWGHQERNENGVNVCVDPPDYVELNQVADAAADAMEAASGLVWPRGNSCEVIYPTSGTTSDYIKGKTSIKWTYTPELGGDDFEAPPSEIPKSFSWMWDGITAMVAEIERLTPN